MNLSGTLDTLRRAVAIGCVAVMATAGPAAATTFYGEFWDVANPNYSINQALNAIDGVAPTATFNSSLIDYPNGNPTNQSSNRSLANFLGTDAASIVGDATATITTSVFRFTGMVELLPGQQTIALGSDDGYRLRLNNVVVSQQNRPRAFRTTTVDDDVGTGIVPFELIFYENYGRTGVEFRIDNTLATPAPVPLPASAGLGLLGLIALGALRKRRRSRLLPLAPAP